MTDTLNNANEFLLAGGAPAAKFPTIGTVVQGAVVAAELREQTDFDTGRPLVWDDGKPRMQLVVTIQTDESDGGDDDGTRRIFAKGQMLAAIRTAVRPHGGIAIGGTIKVRYSRDGEQKKRGFAPPKEYDVRYDPPAKVVALDADDWER